MKQYASPADRSDSRTPVQIPADIYQRIRVHAEHEQRSITNMIVRALSEWLEQREAAA